MGTPMLGICSGLENSLTIVSILLKTTCRLGSGSQSLEATDINGFSGGVFRVFHVEDHVICKQCSVPNGKMSTSNMHTYTQNKETLVGENFCWCRNCKDQLDWELNILLAEHGFSSDES